MLRSTATFEMFALHRLGTHRLASRRLASLVAGSTALALGATASQPHCSADEEATISWSQYKERLARTSTVKKLRAYETMHGELTKAQEERLTNACMVLARVTNPSTMLKLKVELASEDIAVSFRLPTVDPMDIRAQISEVLASVAGAAASDKHHLRDAVYALPDETCHTTTLYTDTGAKVVLRSERPSGDATLIVITAALRALDAKRIEAAYRAAVRNRDDD